MTKAETEPKAGLEPEVAPEVETEAGLVRLTSPEINDSRPRSGRWCAGARRLRVLKSSRSWREATGEQNVVAGIHCRSEVAEPKNEPETSQPFYKPLR